MILTHHLKVRLSIGKGRLATGTQSYGYFSGGTPGAVSGIGPC